MAREIDPKCLEKIEQESGKDRPVWYFCAFTKQGDLLFFNRSGLNIDEYKDEEDPLHGEPELINNLSITVNVTNDGHFVQFRDLRGCDTKGYGTGCPNNNPPPCSKKYSIREASLQKPAEHGKGHQ